MVKRNITTALLPIFIVIGFVISSGVIFAQQFCGSTYCINEAFIGTGGINDTTSASYQARATIGETAVGEVDSAAYKAFGGFETTDVEYLELIVTAATIDMGVLDETTTGTGTGTFRVKTYLASGYSITSSGGTMTNEAGDTLDALTTGGTSSVGTEQFGFNLVANTSPVAQGAAPVQVPDNTFSFGVVDANYATDGTYRYNTGEQIAYSNSSSGFTDYTISYIANVAAFTPAGLYSTNHSIIATSTF
jgi:hypothetical protein